MNYINAQSLVPSVKEALDNAIEEVFAKAQALAGISDGDISPQDLLELYALKGKLVSLIISTTMKNIPKDRIKGQKNMTWDQWEEAFSPKQNTVSNREEYNGWLFETYGEDLEYIKELNADEFKKLHVWTVFDEETDGVFCISEGLHWVNAMGYFVTEKAYDPAFTYNVVDIEEYNH